MNWTRHLRPQLSELTAYDVPPADASFARMHANECPEPWPSEVMDAVAEAVRKVELGRYPDTSGRRLRAILGERLGCDPGRIVLGNGSDEIISTLLTALSGSDGHLVIPAPTFVMYRHSATVIGMPVTEVPLRADFELDDEAMRVALRSAALCFLARPNNPTGNLWDAGVLERWFAAFPDTVFVVDEAYTDYAPGASMWRPDLPENVVLMSTLSKVGGAALRLGYCVATPRLAAELDKVRHPYNISATSLAIAEVLLVHADEARAGMLERARAARSRLRALLASLPGVTVFPSSSNLVLARLTPTDRAPALVAHLRAQGILIKDVSRTPGLEGCVRASVGTRQELDRLEVALREFSRST
ncbi:MAG: aminotransferase class I/II-fold pyridoxal phosphate-dependent enzyme [Nannocystaceae bacterium]|nr:aminotransferase class I/II-fold pyridoxal phosphate-dependent enzyme [Nannocystaceae bacterium]